MSDFNSNLQRLPPCFNSITIPVDIISYRIPFDPRIPNSEASEATCEEEFAAFLPDHVIWPGIGYDRRASGKSINQSSQSKC